MVFVTPPKNSYAQVILFACSGCRPPCYLRPSRADHRGWRLFCGGERDPLGGQHSRPATRVPKRRQSAQPATPPHPSRTGQYTPSQLPEPDALLRPGKQQNCISKSADSRHKHSTGCHRVHTPVLGLPSCVIYCFALCIPRHKSRFT